jgi:hypothetical protein
MSTGKHDFKQTAAARLVRAAKQAGCNVVGIEYEGSKIRVLIDDATAPATATDGSKQWDEKVRANENAKRPT